MKWKVCGMADRDILGQVALMDPDYLGFIFYSKSPRYMVDQLEPNDLAVVPGHIKKIGVFVEEDVAFISQMCRDYDLQGVQLHGHASIALLDAIRGEGHITMKAFNIDQDFDFATLDPYKDYVDYFLFDAHGAFHGGNGTAFDWAKLKEYDQSVPFFLSGGLNMQNVEDAARAVEGMNCAGLDLNSGFEVAPGKKDPKLLLRFKTWMEATLNKAS